MAKVRNSYFSPVNFQPSDSTVPKRGQVLLSEPYISDPFFHRTVILMCENNEEGSFGFVLNNYIDLPISKIIANFPEMPGRVSLGGPVKNDSLFYIHSLGEEIEGSTPIVEGVWYGGDFARIRELIEAGTLPENAIRFFVGYSGWSIGQLQEEITSKSWFVVNVPSKLIMNSKENNVWKEVMERLGPKGKLLSKFPEDPNLN